MTDPHHLIRKEYDQALGLMLAGKLEESAQAMEALLQKNPEFLDGHEGLAMVYSRLGRLDDAIRLMEILEKKDPNNIMVHTNLSVFYMKKGDKERAEMEKAKATVLKFSKGSK